MDTGSLQSLLYTFLDWHPARIQTFIGLIFGVIKAKTVKIKEIAIYIESNGSLHAKIIRIERLFLQQQFSFVDIGRIIFRLLGDARKIKLAIDRTNWQFGKSNLNFFVAAIVYGNISIPIACLMLDKKGNSSTGERKKLIEQILEIIPKDMIELILADREFVGEEWFKYLAEQELPFAIRMKKCEQIRHQNGGKMKLGKYFAGMQVGESKTLETKIYGVATKMTCLKLEKEHLFIASNVVIGAEALHAYKQRWSIERSFKAMKTAGFNLEDTHMTNLKKLEKLFAIVSLSLTICVIAGEIKNTIIPLKIKKHGYRAYSLFTYGFDWLKDYFCNMQNQILSSLFRLLLGQFITAVQ